MESPTDRRDFNIGFVTDRVFVFQGTKVKTKTKCLIWYVCMYGSVLVISTACCGLLSYMLWYLNGASLYDLFTSPYILYCTAMFSGFDLMTRKLLITPPLFAWIFPNYWQISLLERVGAWKRRITVVPVLIRRGEATKWGMSAESWLKRLDGCARTVGRRLDISTDESSPLDRLCAVAVMAVMEIHDSKGDRISEILQLSSEGGDLFRGGDPIKGE